ncbi:MAG: hypothetical protein CL862_00275 [Cyanobium sp. NAT70]|nr:hypothetical protein [Cyanobium sp. NAT70]|tara:strand:+ start:483 stop:704 length:222 start_codon:yes stop_codon:yes gene_type:complete
MEVIFNFSRYEDLRQAVKQLLQESLDPDFLYEEAQDLFDSWWESENNLGVLTIEKKEAFWEALTREFKLEQHT